MSRAKVVVLVTLAFLSGMFLGRFGRLPESKPEKTETQMSCEAQVQGLLQQVRRMHVESQADWQLCRTELFKAVVNERVRLTGMVNPPDREGRGK